MVTLVRIALRLIEDALRWVVLLFRSTESVQAENLFLRRQLALYIERGVHPRPVDAATRVSLAVLARLFGCPRHTCCRAACDDDSLASSRLAIVLAIEAPTLVVLPSQRNCAR